MHSDETLTVCSPQIGIDPESNLGGAVYDREILKALAGLGVRVVIPLPEGEPHADVPNWEIVRTSRHRWKYYEYNLIFRRAVRRLLAEGRTFNVLRAHTAHSVGAGLIGLARRYGIPTQLHYHHWEKHRLRNTIERHTIRRYGVVTTDSEYSRRDLIERFGLDPKRVAVIYPGVGGDGSPGPVDRDLRARFGPRSVLLTVGVLVERKNHAFLLRVMRRLLDEHSDAPVLAIVGSGPLEKMLRDEARRLELGNTVFFAGRVNERTKRQYYNLCDVFVFPSLVEGFGMVVAEAMAHGKPVVASNRTSLPEIVEDGKTGFLADPANEADFAEKIGRLLDSPDRREDMGRAGMRRVQERFDFRRSAQRLLRIYLALRSGEV